MSHPSHQLPIGQLIGNRYRVQALIGRGGMGLVYAASHELTGRRVALKLVLPEIEDSPVLVERFLGEARIAAAVHHPNIVDVLDMGLHEEAPYLVMELLEGTSLEQVLDDQGALAPARAVGWLLPIMGALATLHDAGIVHRDIKPSNIFLCAQPRQRTCPKLLDFGLARVVSDLRLTRSGTTIGTPLYMAPEHAAGLDVGPQADIWSLGVVLYECLAGESPFVYSDRSSLAAQVLAGAARPLSDLRSDMPLLSVVLGRALQRDLSRRYPDVRSFARDLHAACVAAGIERPHDPDPLGLPDYLAWESEAQSTTTTVGQVTPISHELLVGRAPSGTSPRPESMRTTHRPVRTASFAPWLLLLLLAVGGAAYAWRGRFGLGTAEAITIPSVPTPSSAPAEVSPPSLAHQAPEPHATPLPTVESVVPDAGSAEAMAPARVRGRKGPALKPGALKDKAPVQSADEVEAEWK